MRLGIFGMPLHPAARPRTDIYWEDIDRITYADELGFEEAFIGEHMTCPTEPIAAPLMILATLIERTKNIKLGTGVLALPNHHPMIVAAEVAQFDHLSKGRLLFGVGPGGLASDMELFDVLDPQTRGEKLQESIDIILELWRSEPPFHIKTKHFDFGVKETVLDSLSVGHLPRPYQQPHPPIFSTAMSPYSGSIKAAVEKGWNPMSANFCPPAVVASHWKKYVEGCEAIGKEPTGDEWRVARNIVVAPTDEEAHDRVMNPQGGNYFYFDYLWQVLQMSGASAVMKEDQSVPDEDITVEGLVDSMVIYGSPDTVTQKLEALREQSGPFGTLLMAMMDGSGNNEAYERESMRLLAEQVAPRFAKQGAVSR